MNTDKLTPRQARFVENYLLDLNATQAARRAGYSQKTARSIGQRLLTNVDIEVAITEAKRERSEATGVDAAWVLKKAVEVYQRVTQEIRPVRIPKTGKQVYDDAGHALFTFNAAAANRALEIIGKHVEVAAFKDRLEISGEMSLTDRIKAAKEQAYQPALDRLLEAAGPE